MSVFKRSRVDSYSDVILLGVESPYLAFALDADAVDGSPCLAVGLIAGDRLNLIHTALAEYNSQAARQFRLLTQNGPGLEMVIAANRLQASRLHGSSC
jgi:hypothetical protein